MKLITNNSPAKEIKEGLTRKTIHTKHMMVAVLDFSNGPWEAPEPKHQHAHEQITYITHGEVLYFGGEDVPIHMKPGDFVAIPSNLPHSIQLLSEKAQLVDSFNPIREDFL